MERFRNGQRRANIKWNYKNGEYNFCNDEAFILACENGHVDVVEYIVNNAPDYHVYTCNYKRIINSEYYKISKVNKKKLFYL
jgi:hypothetical protein